MLVKPYEALKGNILIYCIYVIFDLYSSRATYLHSSAVTDFTPPGPWLSQGHHYPPLLTDRLCKILLSSLSTSIPHMEEMYRR